MLNPRLQKQSGVWWLLWDADALALAYDILLPDTGKHVQAGKLATRSKLGSSKPVKMPLITAAHGGVYETAKDPDAPPPPPPPPPVTTQLFGACFADIPLVTTPGGRPAEMSMLRSIGGTFPRIDSSNDPRLRSDSDAARAAGFKQWVACLSASKGYFPEVARVEAYARDYPEAWLESVNEPNLGGVWTPEQLVELCVEFYAAAKRGNPNAIVTTPGYGNSEYQGSVRPKEYEKRMQARAGGRKWKDVLSMHWYEPNDYYNIWTPDHNGESMCSVLGAGTKFIVGEFGSRGSGSQQADDVAWRIATLKAQPACLGGQWYALTDDAEGVGGTGWGLFHGTARKPSADAFEAAVKGG